MVTHGDAGAEGMPPPHTTVEAPQGFVSRQGRVQIHAALWILMIYSLLVRKSRTHLPSEELCSRVERFPFEAKSTTSRKCWRELLSREVMGLMWLRSSWCYCWSTVGGVPPPPPTYILLHSIQHGIQSYREWTGVDPDSVLVSYLFPDSCLPLSLMTVGLHRWPFADNTEQQSLVGPQNSWSLHPCYSVEIVGHCLCSWLVWLYIFRVSLHLKNTLVSQSLIAQGSAIHSMFNSLWMACCICARGCKSDSQSPILCGLDRHIPDARLSYTVMTRCSLYFKAYSGFYWQSMQTIHNGRNTSCLFLCALSQ